MKKKIQRLILNRETLVRLGGEQLGTVAGGVSEKPAICCAASGSCPPPPSAGDTTC
jgi:hypothetical protein